MEDAPGMGACNLFDSEEEGDDMEELEESESGSSGGILLTGV